MPLPDLPGLPALPIVGELPPLIANIVTPLEVVKPKRRVFKLLLLTAVIAAAYAGYMLYTGELSMP